MPWRRARRMGQRDTIYCMPTVGDAKFPADRFHERAIAEKLGDGELTDGKNQGRTQQPELSLQPPGTVRNFVGRRHAVAARRTLSRKTTAHRGDVNAVASLVLGPTKSLVKPTKKRSPCRPRKRPAELWLLVARRLTHEQNSARHRPSDNRRPVHPRATFACPHGGKMFFDGDRGDDGHKKARAFTPAPEIAEGSGELNARFRQTQRRPRKRLKLPLWRICPGRLPRPRCCCGCSVRATNARYGNPSSRSSGIFAPMKR